MKNWTLIMDIKDKKAIITGASRGIGSAIARALASEGATVFLTARDDESLYKIKSELTEKGAPVECKAADLTIASQIEDMFSSAVDFLGGIDILINNAGIGIKGEVAEMKLSHWDSMFAVNLRAAFILSRLAAHRMIEQKSGYIINIGSGASQTPIAGFAAYCATKYGLLGFSESLGLELREHNIKVSIILPGSTATHFAGGSPDEKLAAKPGILRPDDVADSVMYLLKQSNVAWTSVMNIRPLNLKKIKYS